jgi:hypothetical protein
MHQVGLITRTQILKVFVSGANRVLGTSNKQMKLLVDMLTEKKL